MVVLLLSQPCHPKIGSFSLLASPGLPPRLCPNRGHQQTCPSAGHPQGALSPPCPCRAGEGTGEGGTCHPWCPHRGDRDGSRDWGPRREGKSWEWQNWE